MSGKPVSIVNDLPGNHDFNRLQFLGKGGRLACEGSRCAKIFSGSQLQGYLDVERMLPTVDSAYPVLQGSTWDFRDENESRMLAISHRNGLAAMKRKYLLVERCGELRRGCMCLPWGIRTIGIRQLWERMAVRSCNGSQVYALFPATIS